MKNTALLILGFLSVLLIPDTAMANRVEAREYFSPAGDALAVYWRCDGTNEHPGVGAVCFNIGLSDKTIDIAIEDEAATLPVSARWAIYDGATPLVPIAQGVVCGSASVQLTPGEANRLVVFLGAANLTALAPAAIACNQVSPATRGTVSATFASN